MRLLCNVLTALAVTVLVACGSNEKAKPGDSTPATDDTADSRTSDDTGEPPPPTETVQLEFSVDPGSDWRLGAFAAHLENEELQHSSQETSYAITGQQMEMGLWPPSTDLLGKTWWSDQGVIFFLAAYTDKNGNEQKDPDEGIVSLSTRVLLYEISDESPKGEWLLAETDDSTRNGEPTRLPLSEGISMASLKPRSPVTISGTVELSNTGGASVRAGTISYYEWLTELPIAGRPLDEPVGETFSFTFSQDLNASRLGTSPVASFPVSIEVPMPYHDADGTNDFSAGDVQLGWTCLGSLHAALLYVPELVDISNAIEAASLGIGPGWLGVEVNINTFTWRLLTASESTNLVMSDTLCGTP